jgi:two-component system chemotaxis response regulator CheY
MRILVADDDPGSCLIIETVLKTLNHECRIAADGIAALKEVSAWHPEVVISDRVMPGFGGMGLCQAIRANSVDTYTYFIMITSKGGTDEVLEGMRAGSDDYLLKPINTDDLKARLVAAARVLNLHHQLASQRRRLEVQNQELTGIARRDPLTGLGNRRALDDDLKALEARVRRYGYRYCMALIDVDHFKSYNDKCGHPFGDQVLRSVAALLSSQVREGDSLYRYGGDEFLCVFPEQSLFTGAKAVERMRIGVESLALGREAGGSDILTISGGIAVLDPDRAKSALEVLKEADEALYEAKRLGRNRVECVVEQSL